MNNGCIFTKQNVIMDQLDSSNSFNILNYENLFLKIFLYKNKEEIKKFILHKHDDEDLPRYLNIICENDEQNEQDYEDQETYVSIVEYFIESFLRDKYNYDYSHINYLLNFDINQEMDFDWLHSIFSNDEYYPFTKTELENLNKKKQKQTVNDRNDDSDDLGTTHYGTSTRYTDFSQNPTNSSSLELVPLAIQSINSQTQILQKEQQKLKFSKYFKTYWNILDFADFESWYKNRFQKPKRIYKPFYKNPNLELLITEEFNLIQIKVSPKLREIFTNDTIRDMIQQTLDELQTKMTAPKAPRYQQNL